MKRESQIPAKVRNTKRLNNHTVTMNILMSSLSAMNYDCPNGDGKKNHPCRNAYDNGIREEIVCSVRRALDYIYSPGKYVTVQFDKKNEVKVI